MDHESFTNRVRLQARLINGGAVREAINFFLSEGTTEERHVPSCVQLAGRFAAHTPSPPESPSGRNIPLPFDDSLGALNLTEAIQPWVEKVRRELFGGPKVPFKSREIAVDWLEKEAARKSAIDPRAEKLRGEMWKKFYELQEVRPTGLVIGLSENWSTIEYIKREHRSFVFCETEVLEKLWYEIREMEKATRLHQKDLLMHILAGSQLTFPVIRAQASNPRLPSVYNLPTGGAIPRYEASFQCLSPRELKKAHLERFYRQVRRIFRISKKKSLTALDRKLIVLLKKHGPPPRKGNLQYWDKLTREWNRGLSGRQLVSRDALRKRYKRLPWGDRQWLVPLKTRSQELR